VAVGLDAERCLAELLGPAVLEDAAAGVREHAGDARQIAAWMHPRLIVEADARTAGKRHGGRERRIEPQLAGERGFGAEHLALVGSGP
jgi:hypothetical protein